MNLLILDGVLLKMMLLLKARLVKLNQPRYVYTFPFVQKKTPNFTVFQRQF